MSVHWILVHLATPYMFHNPAACAQLDWIGLLGTSARPRPAEAHNGQGAKLILYENDLCDSRGLGVAEHARPEGGSGESAVVVVLAAGRTRCHPQVAIVA